MFLIGDVLPLVATRHTSAAAAPADAGAAAATTAATPAATTATASTEPSMSAGLSGPPVPSAPAQPRAARAHAAAQQLPPRSYHDPKRDDLLPLRPGRPILADICATHPLAASAFKAACNIDTGAAACQATACQREGLA